MGLLRIHVIFQLKDRSLSQTIDYGIDIGLIICHSQVLEGLGRVPGRVGRQGCVSLKRTCVQRRVLCNTLRIGHYDSSRHLGD